LALFCQGQIHKGAQFFVSMRGDWDLIDNAEQLHINIISMADRGQNKGRPTAHNKPRIAGHGFIANPPSTKT
jgi:hypothetical protein